MRRTSSRPVCYSIALVALMVLGFSQAHAQVPQQDAGVDSSEQLESEAGADTWLGMDSSTRNIVVGGLVAIVAIVGLILGFTDRAVFYRSAGEAWSLIALPVLAVLMLLAGMTVLQGNDGLVRWSIIGLLGITVLIGYLTALLSNRNPFVALCVGTAKILLVFFLVAFLVKFFFPGGKSRAARSEDRINGAIGSGVFGTMIWRLTNGERVAARARASA